jgi:hypothetical protein
VINYFLRLVVDPTNSEAMGKSAKAKKEKKKEFQKVKLKVGKTRPKAANLTDTSFKARCKIC